MMSYLRFPADLFVFLFKLIVIIVESIVNLITAKESDVTSEIVLITGSGGGIGRELALQYANLG